MVAVTATYYSAYSTVTSHSAARTPSAGETASSTDQSETAATSITLSDAAKAAMAERSFSTVLSEARAKLTKLLEEAGRKSPLQDGALALDMSSLDAREAYAIASDSSFSADERQAAELEMERRLGASLAGPHAIAQVTGDYTGLYKAAAAFLDAAGTEEKASHDWKAARAAVTEGLRKLQADATKLPDLGENDPVGTYIKLVQIRGSLDQAMAVLASNARMAIDQRYAEIHAAGRIPSFKSNAPRDVLVDLAGLSSRTLSAIALNTEGQFTSQEVLAAKAVLRAKSGAALMAGFKSASQSTDPTAFSQNVIAAYSSLSNEERQAAGWSERLYEAAIANYTTSSKLLGMFNQLTSNGSSASQSGLAGLLGS